MNAQKAPAFRAMQALSSATPQFQPCARRRASTDTLNGVPGGIRTHNRLLRRQVLYPVELRGRKARPANWRHFAAIAAFFRTARGWECPVERIRPSPDSARLRQGFGGQFCICIRFKIGGADGDQTHDLVVANDALYQLSYCPKQEGKLVNDAFSGVKQIFPRVVSCSESAV